MRYLLLLFTISCAQIEENSILTYRIESNNQFDQYQLDSIQSAFDQWEVAVDGYVSFKQVDGEADIVIDSDLMANIKEEHGHDAVSVTNPFEIGGDIILPYDATELSFDTAALHEIGHTLGVGHSDNPEDIMYPASPRNTPITCHDVEMFCDANNCDPNHMSVCQ